MTQLKAPQYLLQFLEGVRLEQDPPLYGLCSHGTEPRQPPPAPPLCSSTDSVAGISMSPPPQQQRPSPIPPPHDDSGGTGGGTTGCDSRGNSTLIAECAGRVRPPAHEGAGGGRGR
jgi:hypothetical protein